MALFQYLEFADDGEDELTFLGLFGIVPQRIIDARAFKLNLNFPDLAASTSPTNLRINPRKMSSELETHVQKLDELFERYLSLLDAYQTAQSELSTSLSAVCEHLVPRPMTAKLIERTTLMVNLV